uniref:C-type lectin domain family 4 member E-like n=1 Tax=Pelodiscus sinensis TaxID=13735 RepID=K7FKK0_PELSI
MSPAGKSSPGTAAPPEERRRCSWLNPWVILVCALVLKACVISGCMGGFWILFGCTGKKYKNVANWALGWDPLSLYSPNNCTHVNPDCEVHKALPQSSIEWHCIVGRDEGKGRVWTCCPKDWEPFQASCYYFSKDIMTWSDSKRNCTGMGSHLVVINTGTEQDFVSSYVKRTVIGIQVENYHIGLTQQERGQWRWEDQTPYNKTAAFWIPGEPNNLSLENCVAIDTSQKGIRNNWNNFPCILPFHRICETAATNI